MSARAMRSSAGESRTGRGSRGPEEQRAGNQASAVSLSVTQKRLPKLRPTTTR